MNDSLLTAQLAVIGLAAPDDLVNRLYDGTFQLENNSLPPIAQLVSNALHDAGIEPGRDIALILLGDSSPMSWAGPVYAAPGQSLAQALLLADSLLGELMVRAVILAEAGMGAVVLAAGRDWNRTYAIVESMSSDVAAGLYDPRDIGYLELTNLEDATEIGGVVSVYATTEPDLVCAVGSSETSSALFALIKTVLCVYHRFIPAVAEWAGPADPALWKGSPFYVMPRSKTWFLEPGQSKRRAALNRPGLHLVLAENLDEKLHPNTYLRHPSLKLLIVTADDAVSLIDRLRALDQAVLQATSLDTVVNEGLAVYQEHSGVYTVVLLGHDIKELSREIQQALNRIPEVFEQGGEWFTPLGSYFTAHPLGRRGKIAFVYPGAFSGYPRMGQDLFFLFPGLLDDVRDISAELGEMIGDHWLYARSLEKQTPRHWRQFRERLENHPTLMMQAGVSLSLILTRLMRNFFKIQPDMALGYSLGECSMLFGLDVWTDGDEERARLAASPLYRDRLFGPKNAVRSMWGLPSDAPDDFWSVYFVAAPVDVVSAAVQKEARVYITHINTPTQVVIAGDSEACKRVVATLGVDHLRTSFNTVIHCDVTFSEYERFYALHHLPVRNKPDVCLYSAADYAPIPLDSEVIAHSISRSVCKTLDFPRLIDRVYEDGARIFIELGPRSTCSQWISEILASREHVSVAANQLGVDDHTALLRMLAPLISHGVPLDLSALHSRKPNQIRPVLAVSSENIPYGRTTQAHRAFLDQRLEGLQQLGELLQLQIELYAQPGLAVKEMAPEPLPVHGVETRVPRRPALFDEKALQEFATGSIMACFGPEYALYENRRAPRIPNGDLLLVSRIVEMEAERYHLEPGARAVSEYDIPVSPWFYRDNAYSTIPYSVYMEMGLQLCGLLTAYLGSSLSFPNLDLYFRNLDGQGTLYSDVDLSGRTITNTVHLLSSITLEGIILQKFTFQLAIEGEVFYAGEASFGFFTDRAMQNQTGLDKGKIIQPWYRQQNLNGFIPGPIPDRCYQMPPGKPHYRLAQRQLDLIDTLLVLPGGGQYGQGYIYASKKLDPANWFFDCHFYQDPVMPGSLGVEAILQAMQAFALELDLGQSFRSPCFKQVTPHTTVWHYRGQITRLHAVMMLEIHIKRIEHTPEQVIVIGDASLWRDDGLRIYEVLDVALSIQEAL